MATIQRIYLLLLLVWFTSGLNAQNEKKYRISCIAFYNIENLFDTIDQPDVNDEDFTPGGPYRWTITRYHEKLQRISEVISKIGLEKTPDGPAVMGLSEVENRSVLEDLVRQPAIESRNYQIVHYDGPDRRGIDCALLYNPVYFTVTASQSRRLVIPSMDDFFTRDQLVVSGIFDGEPMHFIVLHWPSRRSGQKRSEPLRIAAARLTRAIVDSLMNINPSAKIVIMGDLNDDPTNKSVKVILKTVDAPEKIKPGTLYNPMAKLYRQGIGTLAFRDSWNLFDQMILSPAFLQEEKTTYTFYRANVFNPNWLIQKEGAFKGYPWRSFAGTSYLGGYSDHLPVYLYLIREDPSRP